MADRDISIDPMHSRAEVRIVSQDASQEQGADGPYQLIRLRAEGPVTSNDPRFEGIFNANAIILLTPDGAGVSRDDWEIVNAQTGEQQVRGTAHGIHKDHQTAIRAVTLGSTADGCGFFGNAHVALPAPGTDDPIVIEYGGPLTQADNRAYIVGGTCDGLLDAG